MSALLALLGVDAIMPALHASMNIAHCDTVAGRAALDAGLASMMLSYQAVYQTFYAARKDVEPLERLLRRW
jgi:hypothetical protein